MNIRKTTILALATFLGGLLGTGSLRAQNVSDLSLSEVMVDPIETSRVDDYGERVGWIEIYNTSTGTVNLGGCFLTDDPSDLKKSQIPTNDLRTQLGPRQTMLFFASGDKRQGTFYTSFKLRKGTTVYLVSNDGRTIVDTIEIPSDLPEGMSVSKMPLDNKRLAWETQKEPTLPTPGTINDSHNSVSKAETIKQTDPHGYILTLVSVSVVFCALAILWFLFWLFFERPAKKAKKAAEAAKAAPAKLAAPTGKTSDEVAAAIALALDMDMGGEQYAAIALAMHLYLSQSAHDQESFIITIKPTEGSAWRARRNFRRSPR